MAGDVFAGTNATAAKDALGGVDLEGGGAAVDGVWGGWFAGVWIAVVIVAHVAEGAVVVGNAACAALVVGFEEHLEIGLDGFSDDWGLGVNGKAVPNGCYTGWGEPLAVALDKADAAGGTRVKRRVVAEAGDLDVVAIAQFQDGLVLVGFKFAPVDFHFQGARRVVAG